MLTAGNSPPTQRHPRTARLVALSGAVMAILAGVLVWGRVADMPNTSSPGTISLDGPVSKMVLDPRTRHLFILYHHANQPVSCGTPAVPAGVISSAVQVIDTSRHALPRTVELGPAMDMTEDQTTGRIVISEGVLSSLCPGPAGHILILDAASGRVLHTTPTTGPCYAVMMNPVNDHILSSCGDFDGRSGRALYNGPNPLPLLIDATTRHVFYIVAVSRTSGTTLEMFAATGVAGPPLRRVILPATGDYLASVTVAPSRAVVIGWDQRNNLAVRVHILDTRTGTILRSVMLRNSGLQFALQAPTLLYDARTARLVVFAQLNSIDTCVISGYGCSNPPPVTAIFVLDAHSGRQIAEFTRVLPPSAEGPSMALDRRRGLVLLPIAASAGQDSGLELLSTRSGAVERTIPVPGDPELVVEDEARGRAYVATGANGVSVVDITH